MDFFEMRNGIAHCEDIPLMEIAKDVGTPAYVYSKATLSRHLTVMKNAFESYPTLLCFAVKSNSNISILREVAAAGFGGDIVSLGELKRCEIAGITPDKIVYSGVGKGKDEIAAALDYGIKAFNVESTFELELINTVAEEKQKCASIALRVNPNIDAKTNPKITTGMYNTKFGMVEDEVLDLALKMKDYQKTQLVGIACHIGSQITNLSPLVEAGQRMASLAGKLKEMGHKLQFINMGGGLGIRYDKEVPPEPAEYGRRLIDAIKETGLTLIIEPGRVLVGNTGVLLVEVIGVKKTPHKVFVVVDGAMNDLMRPSMYDSFHQIECVQGGPSAQKVDIVGPICESGDYFGKDRDFPEVKAGDYLFVRGCGAYAASMASNYNSRPRAVEVMVDGKMFQVIKKREHLSQLWNGEIL